MDFNAILDWIVSKFPIAGSILAVLGSAVVLGTIYIAATPSKDDDAWYGKLEATPVLGWVLVALKRFSVIARKDPPSA